VTKAVQVWSVRHAIPADVVQVEPCPWLSWASRHWVQAASGGVLFGFADVHEPPHSDTHGEAAAHPQSLRRSFSNTAYAAVLLLMHAV
jgi:hypothetical protein